MKGVALAIVREACAIALLVAIAAFIILVTLLICARIKPRSSNSVQPLVTSPELRQVPSDLPTIDDNELAIPGKFAEDHAPKNVAKTGDDQ